MAKSVSSSITKSLSIIDKGTITTPLRYLDRLWRFGAAQVLRDLGTGHEVRAGRPPACKRTPCPDVLTSPHLVFDTAFNHHNISAVVGAHLFANLTIHFAGQNPEYLLVRMAVRLGVAGSLSAGPNEHLLLAHEGSVGKYVGDFFLFYVL